MRDFLFWNFTIQTDEMVMDFWWANQAKHRASLILERKVKLILFDYFDDIFPMKCHHPKFKNELTFTGNASCFRDLFNCTLWLWKMVILLHNFFTLWIEITNSGVRNKMVIVTVALNVYLGGPKRASFIASKWRPPQLKWCDLMSPILK